MDFLSPKRQGFTRYSKRKFINHHTKSVQFLKGQDQTVSIFFYNAITLFIEWCKDDVTEDKPTSTVIKDNSVLGCGIYHKLEFSAKRGLITPNIMQVVWFHFVYILTMFSYSLECNLKRVPNFTPPSRASKNRIPSSMMS